MHRWLEVDLSDIIDLPALQNELTITNPNYVFQKNTLGIAESKITVPAAFPIYEMINSKIRMPRAAMHDPEVSKYINLWSATKIPDIPKPKASKWKKDKTLLPWQPLPCGQILSNEADIIIAECGSGKTVMGTNILSNTKLPVCIVVHTDFLADQWKGEILDFTTITDIKIHKNDLTGRKRSVSKSLTADVVIAKVQSLVNMSYDEHELYKQFYDRFNLVIFDEVHTMGSMEFHKVISNFKCKRVGVTATPDRTDGFRTYMWCIGNRKVIADGKQDVDPVIIGYDTGIGELIDEAEFSMNTRNGPQANIPKVINHQYSFDQRFQLTVAMTQRLLTAGRHVMLLSHRREYAQLLYDAIQFKDKEVLMGGKKIPSGHKQLVVATFQLMRIAFNRPRLDVLINTGVYGAFNDVKQSTGRIIRAAPGKPTPVVIDMYERDKAYEEAYDTQRDGIIFNMFTKRTKAYKKLKYEIIDKRCRDLNTLMTLIQQHS